MDFGFGRTALEIINGCLQHQGTHHPTMFLANQQNVNNTLYAYFFVCLCVYRITWYYYQYFQMPSERRSETIARNILTPVYYYGMGAETAHLAVNYLDRYLSGARIPLEDIATAMGYMCFVVTIMAAKAVRMSSHLVRIHSYESFSSISDHLF